MAIDLSYLGLKPTGQVHRNLPPARLYDEAVDRGEGQVADGGSLIVETGKYTGRSPNDKFIVREPSSRDDIWWGDVNRPFEEAHFDGLLERVCQHLNENDLFVQDCFAGADRRYRVATRIITTFAWHSLFAHNMFIRETDMQVLAEFAPDWHVLYVPMLQAVPDRDHTNSEAFILVHPGRSVVLIGGTCYAGEMKKSIFSVLNYILPMQGVMSMHCSANMDENGETALFFGLSGTGKTTLSASADRILIGDDEHGWSDRGIFNFEGGCYAKVINLSEQAEPEIYATTKQFGTILENVVMDLETRRVDLDDGSLTENTRASYPLESIPNASGDGLGNHPNHLIMLTCDAFGVLPPVASLTPEQAMYHFISGYTAKVAGTERGVKEPSATFSPCFGAPFMMLHPTFYAKQLGEKIHRHGTRCWLVNTGWSGGPYGTGERISISHTRAIINAILRDELHATPSVEDPFFGISVPMECRGVPAAVLQPRSTWDDQDAYDEKAGQLVRLFMEHFSKYEDRVADLSLAGPKPI